MAKTRQINGTVTIMEVGSSCVGCMAWETSYARIKINGETFKYQSDNVDILGLQKYDLVKAEMRVKDNGNVWRFKVIEIFKGI